jgi:hypothetical protein
MIRSVLTSDYRTASVYNEQVFDYAGLQGRLLSSSYSPAAGDPRHEPMLRELWNIFGRHNRNGNVTIEYDTVVHCGRVGERGTLNAER